MRKKAGEDDSVPVLMECVLTPLAFGKLGATDSEEKEDGYTSWMKHSISGIYRRQSKAVDSRLWPQLQTRLHAQIYGMVEKSIKTYTFIDSARPREFLQYCHFIADRCSPHHHNVVK